MNKKNQLKGRIIACLDVADGRVVKGTQFVNLVDVGDPIELALKYQQQGADELVFLDIKASAEKRPTALKTVTAIAENLSIPFTVGGGLKTESDVKYFLDAGADKVTLNTTALLNPSIIDNIAREYGSQCIVVAIDVLRKAKAYKSEIFQPQKESLSLFTHGGRTLVEKNFFDWCQEVEQRGAGEILLTSMHKDGTGSGFDCELTGYIARQAKIQVIASGGAKTKEHFIEAFNANIDACLAAGIFHRNEITIQQVKQALSENGVNVRITNQS